MYNLIKRSRQTKKKKRTLNQERNLSTHIDLIISHLKFHDTMNPKKNKTLENKMFHQRAKNIEDRK